MHHALLCVKSVASVRSVFRSGPAPTGLTAQVPQTANEIRLIAGNAGRLVARETGLLADPRVIEEIAASAVQDRAKLLTSVVGALLLY